MTDRRYWFPAQRHGWGWGFPSCWQGWLVVVVFVVLVLVFGGAWLFPPAVMRDVYLAYFVIVAALFYAVLWLTGEPLR